MSHEAGRSPPVQPGISRSSTYHVPPEYSSRDRDTREPRGRDRSRLQPQVLSEEEDSEDDRRYESSRRPDRRHRTHSPEPMPADYPPAPRGSAYRYHVKEGRTVPIAAAADPNYYYPEDSSPPSRKSKSATYYQPYVRTQEVRPSMPSRDSAYSSSGSYMPSKIKTQQSYTPHDVQYSYEPATGWA